MQFGLDKYAKATFIRGRSKSISGIEQDESASTMELGHKENYKYIEPDERDGIQHAGMKEKIKKKVIQMSKSCPANKIRCQKVKQEQSTHYNYQQSPIASIS